MEIHRQLYQQSFAADFPLLVTQNCHGAPAVHKIVLEVGAKATEPEHNAKRMESALTITVVYLFLHHKKFLSAQL